MGTAAIRAAVLVTATIWLSPGHAEPTDYAMLPSLKTELADEGLLLDVARGANDRLLVAGELGRILYSDDDGQTWTQADVPVSLTITSVAFGGGEAWATAHDGFLLQSSDSGTTWQVKLSGADVARLSVVAIEESIEAQRAAIDAAEPEDREDLEWALDDSLFALEEATAAIDEGMTSPMLSVWFASELEGYALGAYGVFLHTVDGGESWKMESNRLENPDKYHLYAMTRSAAGTLLIAGEAGTLLRSVDGGNSWERIESIYAGSFFGAVAASDGSLLIFGLRGNVFRSTDEGESWERVRTGDQRTLMCGTATDDGSVILAGSAGAILKSDDNGASFGAVPTEGSRVYSAVAVQPDGKLIVTGFGGISFIDPGASGASTGGQR